MNRPKTNQLATPETGCADQVKLGERELAAFFTASKHLFGQELAELSAKQWVRELAKIDGLPASRGEWRQITLKASAWLADRIKASLRPDNRSVRPDLAALAS